jgi:DNA repair protein RecO (recombination protein O)
MALSRDRCICVRKFEYSETSQILTLFGASHGLLRVIAKGAHRRTKAGHSKFDGGADLLDVGHAVFTFDPAKELNILTEWSLREGNLPLRKNLRGMYLGLYAAEMLSSLFEEHDPHPDLYRRFEASLRDLGNEKLEETFLAFQLDLLHQSGNLGDPAICVECFGPVVENRLGTFFSPTRGGAICPNCETSVPDRLRIDPRLLRLAGQLLKLPRNNGVALRLPRLTRHQTDPLNRLFAGQIRGILGKPLRMSAYINPEHKS